MLTTRAEKQNFLRLLLNVWFNNLNLLPLVTPVLPNCIVPQQKIFESCNESCGFTIYISRAYLYPISCKVPSQSYCIPNVISLAAYISKQMPNTPLCSLSVLAYCFRVKSWASRPRHSRMISRILAEPDRPDVNRINGCVCKLQSAHLWQPYLN